MGRPITFELTLMLLVIALNSCNIKTQDVPENIDHLVYTAPSLEEGMDQIEKLLGVRPVIGGRHPHYGTHNALLSLGESTYLEIIAPDPELSRPARGRLLEASFTHDPKLTTWVMRTEHIQELHARAISKGLTIGPVESGKREKPDGTVLAWQLSDPYAFPLDGAIPFLISWGDTPHPAGAVPKAGNLEKLIIEHPHPQLVEKQLEVLGVNIEVRRAAETRLIAKIKTEVHGIVALE